MVEDSPINDPNHHRYVEYIQLNFGLLAFLTNLLIITSQMLDPTKHVSLVLVPSVLASDSDCSLSQCRRTLL